MKNVTNCVGEGVQEKMVRKAGVKRPFPVGWFIGELKLFTIAGNHFFIPVKTLFT